MAFNTNGAGFIDSITLQYGHTINYLPTPTKPGYDFVGWFVNDDKIEIGDTFNCFGWTSCCCNKLRYIFGH